MKQILAFTAFLGAITIILGAFGAHALDDKLAPGDLKNFDTGVRYMMFHVLALLVINTNKHITLQLRKTISILFISGMVCFSGSLFIISTSIVPAKTIWFVTPLGGLLFILGWIFLGIAFLKKNI